MMASIHGADILVNLDWLGWTVYHIDASSAEPVGGIARFKTVINEYRDDARFSGQSEMLTFFSGDAFNPSLESSVTKGEYSPTAARSLFWSQTQAKYF